MKEEKFQELMADARVTYNRAPDLPPFDEMWDAIDQARHEEVAPAARRRPLWSNPWLRSAAVLVLGIGLGRISASVGVARDVAQQEANSAVASANSVPDPYKNVTDEYLGEAAALLIALPDELNARRVDSGYLSRADQLLAQTRLLLDSPAASDPSLRGLFEDLELVLVQIVRLQAGDQMKIDLLNQSLQENHVIPRLRDAVVDHIAD